MKAIDDNANCPAPMSLSYRGRIMTICMIAFIDFRPLVIGDIYQSAGRRRLTTQVEMV